MVANHGTGAARGTSFLGSLVGLLGWNKTMSPRSAFQPSFYLSILTFDITDKFPVPILIFAWSAVSNSKFLSIAEKSKPYGRTQQLSCWTWHSARLLVLADLCSLPVPLQVGLKGKSRPAQSLMFVFFVCFFTAQAMVSRNTQPPLHQRVGGQPLCGGSVSLDEIVPLLVQNSTNWATFQACSERRLFETVLREG